MQDLDMTVLAPKSVSVVHGDLTLENIMVNEQNSKYRLIDTDGARLFDAMELDLGKLSQSILSSYSSWKNCKNIISDISKNNFICKDEYFTIDENELTKFLIEKWSLILNKTESETMTTAIYYMSTYFLRFVPFRMKISKNHGIFALLMATVWMNKISKKKK
jgi:5-methylthioribose kinase